MQERRTTPTNRHGLDRRARFWIRRRHTGIFRILWIPVADLFTRSFIVFP